MNYVDIEETIKEFMDKREPDLKIYEDSKIFSCKINGYKTSLLTGKGGLVLFIKQIPEPDFLKIEYNGIILNKEQKEELFSKLKQEYDK